MKKTIRLTTAGVTSRRIGMCRACPRGIARGDRLGPASRPHQRHGDDQPEQAGGDDRGLEPHACGAEQHQDRGDRAAEEPGERVEREGPAEPRGSITEPRMA